MVKENKDKSEEAGTEVEDSAWDKMDLFEHIGELRKRLIISAVAIVALAGIAFMYANPLFQLASEPFFSAFPDKQLIGTGPAEAFILKLKVAFFGGFMLALPIIFWQLWLFIAPGLYEHEQRLVLPFVFFTTIMFLGGVVFCFTVVMPFAYEFFEKQYTSIGVQPTIRISEHLALLLKAMFGFGLVFEMPVLAFLLGRIGLITAATLIQGARYAVVIIFLLAAILTPPDVLTQFLMAGPLLLLYGLSILIVKFTGKSRQ